MSSVADTGFIVAVFSNRDRHRERCLSVYNSQGTMYVPQTVLAETAYLMAQVGGNRLVANFLLQLSETMFEIIPLIAEDLQRTAELLQQYADTRLDFVDATVIAVAERLDITEILTLDRRDFSMVRPR